MPITRICLVRHGETAWNAQHRLQGHEDIPLNPRGLAQAQAVATALASCEFAAAYHSDLQRAALTARTIAAHRPFPVIAEPALRERHFGALQGLTRDEAEQHYPGIYGKVRTREPFAGPPGNGESLNTFAQRISQALHAIAARHAGQSVLIVSHGGCMDIMYRIVTGKPLTEARDFALGNATLNWVEWQDQRWNLRVWDEKDHLSDCFDEISA
ncbi:histidine phosphatase family protein [Uliginosibacterium sp. 31-16]|uniref:histidine phosphatase family protein n=1 Tax=Uliginosibacterium sp. 31-16 TaxID=3068315 RepID=UPI00273F53B2|nr:histidine phosphatase family protein [Uliginosibacterium sp. 31-16]MDP5240532.1 histidine phosphatase family protein [Uliginosibacterium sp. 31-16]